MRWLFRFWKLVACAQCLFTLMIKMNKCCAHAKFNVSFFSKRARYFLVFFVAICFAWAAVKIFQFTELPYIYSHCWLVVNSVLYSNFLIII